MERKISADLHNHTTASDGEYSSEELICKAAELGLKAISITDHDSIAALNQAIEAGNKHHVRIIPGVEVTLRFKEDYFVGSLHCLLYFSKQLLDNSDFVNDLNSVLGNGRGPSLVKVRVTEINKYFGPSGLNPILKHELTIDEIASYGENISRRHFALALQEKHGINDKDQINQIIGNDSPAYIPSGIAMVDLHPFIQKYPVITVFAHPAAGSFPGDSHYKEVLPNLETVEQLLPQFLSSDTLGINGVEVYYPGHTPELCQTLLNWAERYNLLITGGSDCHDRVTRPLGVEGVTDDELSILEEEIEEAFINWFNDSKNGC